MRPSSSPSRAAALRLSLGVAAVLLIAALADPSGIFAWVGWTGSPVAAMWWWAPYVVQVPAVLAIVHVGTLWSASGAAFSRSRMFFGGWALATLAAGIGAVLHALCVLLPLAWRGAYVIGWGPTWGFVLWSSGYAALKMALVGWFPALLASMGRSEPASIVSTRPPPDVATRERLGTGLAALAVALLGPWLAAHWWQGGPLGFTRDAGAPLLAPTPASGAGLAALALAVLAALLRRGLARRLADAPLDDTRATFAAGAIAGVGAAAGLLLVQALALLPSLRAHAAHPDSWWMPTLFVRAVDAASFALVVAFVAGASAVVAGTLQRACSRRTEGALHIAGVVAFLASLGIEYGAPAPPAAAAIAAIAQPSPADAGAPSPLSVRSGPAGPQIVDASGAPVTLRGVNINQLGEYFRRDPALPAVQPLAEQDFADIAALGMNVVRLTLSWSLLEPERGQVSRAYLDRIRQALAWARAHRVRVLLDMHQDGWGAHVAAPPGTRCRAGTEPMTGWDGAPAWATLADATPPCMVTGRDLAPNVSRAFQSFYVDRDDIQSHLVHGWQVLAAEFGDDATVAGYDLLNEPNFGESPPLASTLLLANYYARSIAAIRAGEAQRPGGFAHLVLIEPSIIWSGFGIDNLPPRGFTADTQLVFSPHLYNESITADQDFGLTLVSVERGVALAQAAAAQLGAPLWIGEWGYFRAPALDAPLMLRSADAEDTSTMGSTFWVWKQGCSDPHVWPGAVAGNVRLLSCPQGADIGTATALMRVLARPYVRVSADAGARLRASADRLVLEGVGAGHGCALQLWVPGDAAPQVTAVAGMSAPQLTRQAPGSASLGASGGWLVDACLAGGPWRLQLRR